MLTSYFYFFKTKKHENQFIPKQQNIKYLESKECRASEARFEINAEIFSENYLMWRMMLKLFFFWKQALKSRCTLYMGHIRALPKAS